MHCFPTLPLVRAPWYLKPSHGEYLNNRNWQALQIKACCLFCSVVLVFCFEEPVYQQSCDYHLLNQSVVLKPECAVVILGKVFWVLLFCFVCFIWFCLVLIEISSPLPPVILIQYFWDGAWKSF